MSQSFVPGFGKLRFPFGLCPARKPIPKGSRIVYQASICRCELLVLGRVYNITTTGIVKWLQMHTDEFLKGVDDQFPSEIRKCSSLFKRMVVGQGCKKNFLGQFLHPHHLHHPKKWMFETFLIFFDWYLIRFTVIFGPSSSILHHPPSYIIIFHHISSVQSASHQTHVIARSHAPSHMGHLHTGQL